MAQNSPTMTAIHNLILSYFPENILNIDSPIYPLVSQNIDSFLRKEIPYNQLYDSINSLVKFTQPIEKLHAILQTSSEPISAPSEEDLELSKIRRKSRQWTNYEDQRLLCAIYKYGIENWTQISKFVGNGRTRSQCSQRWYRGLNPTICKTQWTKEEEKKLIDLVRTYGDKSWTNISSRMGNRSDVQCRYRYRQLKKEIRHDDVFYELDQNEKESSPLLHKVQRETPAKIGQNQVIPPYIPSEEQQQIYPNQSYNLPPIQTLHPAPTYGRMYYMQSNNVIANQQIFPVPNQPQQPFSPIVMVPNQQIIPLQPNPLTRLPDEHLIQENSNFVNSQKVQTIQIPQEIQQIQNNFNPQVSLNITTPLPIHTNIPQTNFHQVDPTTQNICSPEDIKHEIPIIVNSPSTHIQIPSVVQSPYTLAAAKPFLDSVQSPRFKNNNLDSETGTIEQVEGFKITKVKTPAFDAKMYSVC